MKQGYGHMRCGLLGEHLGHSFSPIIHKEIADYSYDLVELSPEEVGPFVLSDTLDAYNVTIPYKKTVMPFLDVISPEAQAIGAVNTVVRGKDGKRYGYNTDYFGFDYMIRSAGMEVKNKKAIVFGTGGASATVCAVLRDRGVRELVVIGRKDNTPEVLVRHADTEIVVNTTPVGMFPKNGEAPVELSLFPRCEGVLDVIYNPAKTALLLDAEARSIPYANGLSMLVAQAVKAFEYFTGDIAEDSLTDAAVQAIARATHNVVLIGMPGCGKSTVGRLLADTLGRPFYDADDEFFTMHGRTPAEIIRTEGEERFREMEHTVLCELGKQSGTVIATGGGAVTREYNYAPLHQNGVILFLDRDVDKLPSSGRPLSQAKSPAVLYRERIDAYHRFADYEIKSTENPEQTAALMLACIQNHRYGGIS